VSSAGKSLAFSPREELPVKKLQKMPEPSSRWNMDVLLGAQCFMTERGSCIIAKGWMKRFSSRLCGFLSFESTHPFIMFPSFFVTFPRKQNISQPLAAVLLPVNLKKEMAFILGIDLCP
jgi:hypothetical protein